MMTIIVYHYHNQSISNCHFYRSVLPMKCLPLVNENWRYIKEDEMMKLNVRGVVVIISVTIWTAQVLEVQYKLTLGRLQC